MINRRNRLFKPLLHLLFALLCWVGLVPAAHADWTDDVNVITRLMQAGDYAAAEKACTDSLTRGPSGLFSGTGTLIIHHWRGRARLLQGNAAGALEDGDAIIRTNNGLFPPDAGYGLRGIAKAMQGDAAGSRAEFEALEKVDRSGALETIRVGGSHGERAIARILSDDLDGADADLAAATAVDYGFLGGSFMKLNKQAWAEMRIAVASVKAGNQAAALDSLYRARAILLPTRGSEFVSAQLLINKYTRASANANATTPVTATAKPAGRAASWPVPSKVLPGQRSHWGFVLSETAVQGVSIIVLKKDTPAGAAGLEGGDVLRSIEGRPIKSLQEFRAIKDTFPFFSPLKLEISRKGERLERTIYLSGTAPFRLRPSRVAFTIPGIASPDPGALAALTEQGGINVLDQVVLDPVTGKIAVIGHYDDRFATGPIPYLDLLKTALAHPQPKLNLEDDSERQLDQLDQGPKDWLTKEFVLTHPSMAQDGQLMLKAWAEQCKLLPEELALLYNHVHFARKDVTPPVHIRQIQEKLLRNLGYADAADAYSLVNQPGANAPLKALQRLGRQAEAQTIQARSAGNAATASGLQTAAVYLAILERIHAPEAEIFNFRLDLSTQRRTWQEVVMAAQGSLFPARASDDPKDLAKAALRSIMISTRGTRAMMPQLRDQETEVVPIDLPPDSQLTRVLYEADYALKSLIVMPHLFSHIPGAMRFNEYEFRKKIEAPPGQKRLTTEHRLEPDQVIMNVSPGRSVVTFEAARMRYRTRIGGPAVSEEAAHQPFDEWSQVLTSHYDDYARLIPPFHEVREAAKVIALANWLIKEKVPTDLRNVPQERWDNPGTIPGFWRSALSFKGDDGGPETLHVAYSGGVTFKRQNWTEVTAAPPARETGAANHLALSAQLGQRAVQEAEGGDLEAARHFAELSAQAMSGSLSPADLAKMNIPMPPAVAAPLSPERVQLQQALLQRTQQQIATVRQDPASAATAKEAFKALNRVYVDSRDQPAAASDFLKQLQTRQAAVPVVPAPSKVERASESICGLTAPPGLTLAADRKAYLNERLTQARDRLRYINEALRKLIAINAAERAEIDKLTAELSVRYEEAQDRALDVVLELMTGTSLDAFGAEQAKRLKGLDDAISAKIALKSTPQDAAALRAIEDEIRVLQSAKFRAQEAYAATEAWVKHFKLSKMAKDTDDWWRKNEELKERAKGGLMMVAGWAIDHPWLEKWLGKQAWFAGEKLWQVATLGKMTYYAAGFAYDILAQWTVWEPMTHRMQNDLKYNVQSIERLRQRSEQMSQEIGCLQSWLR